MEFYGRETVEVDTEWRWFFYFNSAPPIYLLCVDLNVNKTRSDLMFSAERSPEGFIKSTLRSTHLASSLTRHRRRGHNNSRDLDSYFFMDCYFMLEFSVLGSQTESKPGHKPVTRGAFIDGARKSECSRMPGRLT